MNNAFLRRISVVMLVLLAACANPDANTGSSTEPAVADNAPAIINYQLINTYPHDAGAFTQGLVWYNNHLVEGTGQLGESNIRHVELATGKVSKEVKNAADIFGEGITILNGKIYQLTWQNKKAFVYDVATLKQLQEFPLKTEGWGITHNGTELIVSDGSSNLYFLNPANFQETKRIGVADAMGPKGNLNELEYINGFVYANIWQTDDIVKIDPNSGQIVGRLNFADLKSKVGITSHPMDAKAPDVLNGIAYDSAGQRLFITGKYWPKLFEIKLQ